MFLKKRFSGAARAVVALLAAVLVVGAFYGFTRLAGGNASAQGRAIAEQSIRRAAVQCYALEGVYPPSVDYLRQHYGLGVKDDLYFVDYRFVAANLMPEVTVLLWVTDVSEVME